MFQFEENKIVFTLDKAIYSEAVLFKCIYWFIDQYAISISQDDSNFYLILILTPNLELNDNDKNKIALQVLKSINDFKLRQIILEETKTIRELLIAKAFLNSSTSDSPLTES